jgi:hypothetical protein
MTKYTVVGIVSGSMSIKVEANSPEEAAENAELAPCLCHQCSDEVELGDVYELAVYEGNKEVWTDRADPNRDAKILAQYLKSKKKLPKDVADIVARLTK